VRAVGSLVQANKQAARLWAKAAKPRSKSGLAPPSLRAGVRPRRHQRLRSPAGAMNNAETIDERKNGTPPASTSDLERRAARAQHRRIGQSGTRTRRRQMVSMRAVGCKRIRRRALGRCCARAVVAARGATRRGPQGECPAADAADDESIGQRQQPVRLGGQEDRAIRQEYNRSGP